MIIILSGIFFFEISQFTKVYNGVQTNFLQLTECFDSFIWTIRGLGMTAKERLSLAGWEMSGLLFYLPGLILVPSWSISSPTEILGILVSIRIKINKTTNVLSSCKILKYNAVPLFFFMCDHTRVVSSGKAPKTVGGFVLLFFSLRKVKTRCVRACVCVYGLSFIIQVFV